MLWRTQLICIIWKRNYFLFLLWSTSGGGPGSVVGIATDYGLDGLGIETRLGRDFSHLSRPNLGPTQPPVQQVASLSRGKERPRRDADPSPLLVSWSRKSRAIPLLPVWSVQPVQNLSACTRVHFRRVYVESEPIIPSKNLFKHKFSCSKPNNKHVGHFLINAFLRGSVSFNVFPCFYS